MTNNAGPLMFDGIDRVILSLGDNRFREELIAALNNITRVDHFSLVQLTQGGVRYITSANAPGTGIPQSLQQLYLTRYYRLDPNRDYLQLLDTGDGFALQRLLPADIEDQGYQKLWCEQFAIVDRLSLLIKADGGLYCCNLYRQQTPFSERDVDIIETLGPLLSALAVKHTRLAGSLSGFQTREAQIQELSDRIRQLDDRLSERELQVCARILLGMSSEGIALDLDIKIASVQTYRKRAYAKLTISSQNELFALCVRSP